MKRCTKVYENNYKNPKSTNKEDLETFLQLIANLNTEITLFAIGGTAMLLKNIKESTKDIDFITTLDYKTINQLFKKAGLKEQNSSQLCNIWYLDNIRIDLFYDNFIMGVKFPKDWINQSEHLRNIGKIRLYILNWYDIIITKIARSEERDIEDILAIMRVQKLNLSFLKNRYYQIAETSLIADYNLKFKHFKREYDKSKTD